MQNTVCKRRGKTEISGKPFLEGMITKRGGKVNKTVSTTLSGWDENTRAQRYISSWFKGGQKNRGEVDGKRKKS